MNKIEIGSKVVDIHCGEEGVVNGINNDDGRDAVLGETAWWALWETGGLAGKEFWMAAIRLASVPECDVEEFTQHNLPVGE